MLRYIVYSRVSKISKVVYYDHITTDQADKTHLYTERCAATGLFLIFLTQVAATVRNRVRSKARRLSMNEQHSLLVKFVIWLNVL